jgi:hypothetical protein
MNREEFIKSLNLKGLGIEIGVQSGNYSSKILEYSNLHLILLDSWRELNDYHDKANVNTDQHIMFMNNTLKRLKEFDGRFTLMRELSEIAVDFFKDEIFDFIYMDANHSEEFVYNDLIRWYPKVKKGGILAGHDYLNLKEEINDFGVKDAVDKFFYEKDIIVNTVDIHFPTWFIQKPL